ncbi:hypothetical protein BKI52_40105 [marine bacterium AO1-C]|nr:hypothetical protein BKI52_40105 [marine bacterium AO1-C]
MYRDLRIGLGVFLLFWAPIVIAQPGSKLTSQPAGELRELSLSAEKFVEAGDYQNAYNTYLKLVKAYQQRANQAGVLENVDKIIDLHQQKKITLPNNTLTYYYRTQQNARKALNLKTSPKNYLDIAEVHARSGNMKLALYYAEKGVRLSNNAETADLLNVFIKNLNKSADVSGNAASNLSEKLRAVQKELLRKDNALSRLRRHNTLLRKQVISQAEDIEKLDRDLKSEKALAANRQRINNELESDNNSRKWWNIVLLFLASAGVIVAGYSAAKLYFNARRGKRVKQELAQKNAELLTTKSKLEDAEDTISSQTDEIQDKKYTIQRHLSEIDGRKEELVELTEESLAIKKKLDEVKDSKVQLAETIAQDLKKPLDMVLRSQDLVAIKGAGSQMKKYTEEMLVIQQYLNKELDIKKGDYNFHQMVQNTIDPWMERANKKGVEIVNEVPTQYWGLFDKGLISRVIEKLFRKAVQHTITGGKVTITGKAIPEGAETTPIVGMKLTISDSGASILYDEFQKVFKPLMEMDARSFTDQGIAGIDLTFCKVALEAHQTSINVITENGQGTMFSFQLPLGTPQQMVE